MVHVSTKMLALVLVAGMASFACSSSKSGTDAAGATTGADAAGAMTGTDSAVGVDGTGVAGSTGTDAGASKDGSSTVDSTGPSTGDGGATKLATASGAFTVFAEPFGPDAGPSPFMTVTGSVDAYPVAGGKMRLTLMVTGLPAAKTYGAHLHKLTCTEMKAGGHYQNMPAPPDASANDPLYGNNTNEAWLDFTTDAGGKGMSETTVDWVPRKGEANAVVIHAMMTADGGIAGAKLACIDVKF